MAAVFFLVDARRCDVSIYIYMDIYIYIQLGRYRCPSSLPLFIVAAYIYLYICVYATLKRSLWRISIDGRLRPFSCRVFSPAGRSFWSSFVLFFWIFFRCVYYSLCLLFLL